MSALITETLTPYKIVSQLPPDTVVTFHGVSWEEYEQLLERVGEASGLRLSYDDGTLQAMTLSYEHENYACFLDKLITVINLRLRINIRSFGSATMKKRRVRKGNEPDACYYVPASDVASDASPDVVSALQQIAHLLGGTLQDQTDARAKLQTLIDTLQGKPAVATKQ